MNLDRKRPPNPFDFLPPVPEIRVESPAILPDQRLADAHHGSAAGGGTSPAIRWAEGPEGTESYAVTMIDIDAPTPGGVYHWVLVNIPKDVRSLDVGGGGVGTTMLNDLGARSYVGAAPPPGDHPHRYLVTVWAHSAPRIEADEASPAALVGFHLTVGSLARGSLVTIV